MTLVVSLLAFAFPVSAQVVSDPYDPLYTDLEVWEAKGLTGRLPALQPYPLQMIRHLLERVNDHADSSLGDQARARWHLARLGDPLHVTLDLDLRGSSAAAAPYVLTAIDPDVQGMVTPWLGGSARVRLMFVRLDDGLLLPAATGNPEDFVSDVSDIDVGSQKLQVRQLSHGSFGIGEGDGSLLFQVGMGRHRIGPFWENGVVIGQQAAQAGQFSLLLQQELFTAHVALYELTATTDEGLLSRSGKHVFFHGVDFHPLPWLDVGAFETVTSGGRLEILYFIPITSFFHSQGLNGFADNSMVGLNTRVSPTTGMDFKGVLYVDDISFNDMARGNFNTKYKLAAQVGASFSPAALFDPPEIAEPWRLVTIDYTAVMPYMFTHINSVPDDVNFETYSNAGANFGPALEPNSDRIEVRALWRPLDDPSVSFVDVEGRAAAIRHGNASAGIIPDRDGSIFDDGFLDGVPTFQPPFVDPTGQPPTRFLTQSVIEETFQLGASVRFHLDGGVPIETAADDGTPELSWDRGWGGITASLGYTWQRRGNADLVDGRTRHEHFVDMSLAWRF